MIDKPDRKVPRFPAGKEYMATNAISEKLDAVGASKDDLALCGGACGGDLLFAEACLERDLSVEIRIPFEEPTFFIHSVTFAGNEWRNRFYKVKNHPIRNCMLCLKSSVQHLKELIHMEETTCGSFIYLSPGLTKN
jgi:hypothetical protein